MQEINGCQISPMQVMGMMENEHILVSNQESDRHSVFRRTSGFDD